MGRFVMCSVTKVYRVRFLPIVEVRGEKAVGNDYND